MSSSHLDLNAIKCAAARLDGHILRTPTILYSGQPLPGHEQHQLHIKMELLQTGGSFKLRGALNVVNQLPPDTAGIVAFSAGNHAIAAALAGKAAGLPVSVVMPNSANPYRVQRCREEGANVHFGNDISDLMNIVERLQREQGLSMVHP